MAAGGSTRLACLLTLRFLPYLLHQRDRQTRATFCRERAQQSASQDARKQTNSRRLTTLSCSGPSRFSTSATSARASLTETARSQLSLPRAPQVLPRPGYLSTPMARM
jgi:hypothetical protein